MLWINRFLANFNSLLYPLHSHTHTHAHTDTLTNAEVSVEVKPQMYMSLISIYWNWLYASKKYSQIYTCIYWLFPANAFWRFQKGSGEMKFLHVELNITNDCGNCLSVYLVDFMSCYVNWSCYWWGKETRKWWRTFNSFWSYTEIYLGYSNSIILFVLLVLLNIY